MIGNLFLVHWNASEVEAWAEELRAIDWVVTTEAKDGERAGRRVLGRPPDVIVVSLRRLPSHGRETAHYIRSSRAGRRIPIVFVDGEGDAVEKVQAKIPDAVYTTSGKLTEVLVDYIKAEQAEPGSAAV